MTDEIGKKLIRTVKRARFETGARVAILLVIDQDGDPHVVVEGTPESAVNLPAFIREWADSFEEQSGQFLANFPEPNAKGRVNKGEHED